MSIRDAIEKKITEGLTPTALDIADDGDGRRVDLGFRHVFGCLLEGRRQRTLGGQ